MLVIGCSTENEHNNSSFGLEKVQKIEVLLVENPESILITIDNTDEISDFVNKLNIPQWSNDSIPSDATSNYIYTIYQEDTVTLGENNNNQRKLKQIATITTYKEVPYIKFQTKKLTFSFKVPEDVAEYLSNPKTQRD